jgi:hypothetical protein
MMVLDFGWNTKFIVKTEDALKIINILEKAEMYEEKWRKEEDGGTTYHVWPVGDKLPGLKIVSESLYQMAKLAGKPEKA